MFVLRIKQRFVQRANSASIELNPRDSASVYDISNERVTYISNSAAQYICNAT